MWISISFVYIVCFIIPVHFTNLRTESRNSEPYCSWLFLLMQVQTFPLSIPPPSCNPCNLLTAENIIHKYHLDKEVARKRKCHCMLLYLTSSACFLHRGAYKQFSLLYSGIISLVTSSQNKPQTNHIYVCLHMCVYVHMYIQMCLLYSKHRLKLKKIIKYWRIFIRVCCQ